MPKKITPRVQQGLNTRQKIFETALALFAKKGYERVTVDDICAKSGVTKGAFYNHFASKDQIMVENFVRIDQYYQEILAEIDSLDSSLEKVKAFSGHSMKYISGMGVNNVRALFHSQIAPGKKNSAIMSRKRPLYKISQKLVREAQQNGEIREDLDSAEITDMVIRCSRGVIYDWCLANGKFDLEATGTKLLAALIKGLQKDAPGTGNRPAKGE